MEKWPWEKWLRTKDRASRASIGTISTALIAYSCNFQNSWLHLLVLLDPKIANSDYLVNGCRESQPNGQAIHAIIRGSKMP